MIDYILMIEKQTCEYGLVLYKLITEIQKYIKKNLEVYISWLVPCFAA